MARSGSLAHIDFSVGDPDRSIPFYAALLEALGYRRRRGLAPAWDGPHPTRATWFLEDEDGGIAFEIDLRPARPGSGGRRYDRYEPGPHHIAFHAASRAAVDAVHGAMVGLGASVLDPPVDYSGQPGYEEGYYAAFFADPDGFKVEVVYLPSADCAVARRGAS
jgi:glyoxylase I family protein